MDGLARTAKLLSVKTIALATAFAMTEPVFVILVGLVLTAQRRSVQESLARIPAVVMVPVIVLAFNATVTHSGPKPIAQEEHAQTIAVTTAFVMTESAPVLLVGPGRTAVKVLVSTVATAMVSAKLVFANVDQNSLDLIVR